MGRRWRLAQKAVARSGEDWRGLARAAGTAGALRGIAVVAGLMGGGEGR